MRNGFLPAVMTNIVMTARRVVDLVRQRHTEAATLSPHVRRRPLLIRWWLTRARRAQVATLLLLSLTAFATPPVLDVAIDAVHPDQKILGLIPKSIFGENRKAETQKRTAQVASWLLTSCAVAFAFWLQLPGAVAAAAVVSRRRESEADRLRDTDLLRSATLYRVAIGLTIEPEREASLTRKLEAMQHGLAHGAAQSAPPALGCQDGTLVAPLRIGEPRDPRRVGPDGRYEIHGEIARGGMAIVHRARDRALGRDIALKELPLLAAHDPRMVERFRQEARALARISHPGIVQVYDLIEENGHFWMVMELVNGWDLASVLDADGPLEIEEAITLTQLVARALEAAHQEGIVHRDVKPQNILLTRDRQPKLADFGIVKLANGTSATRAGELIGSPAYMSPEQSTGGPVDHRTDIYSLGVVLFEMLAGEPPFDGELVAMIVAQRTEAPPALGDVTTRRLPDGLEALVDRMLAKDPGRRPRHMGEVVEGLEPLTWRSSA